jgi:phytoene dehydrogenase-like protein
MNAPQITRRDILKMLACALPAATIDWSLFPRGKAEAAESSYDVIVIGSGLAGLACAAAFARQGFKPLVIEQHDKPGGFATAFKRPGGFLFDVSLHSTSVGERNGLYNLINGFPEITKVDFLPHPSLFRSIYPEHDLRIAQKDLAGYLSLLTSHFPEEKEGIAGLFADMQGLSDEVRRISGQQGRVDYSRFAIDFPCLARFNGKSWGEMADTRIENPKLKAIVSGQWGYYGLPPARLSCYYYALPFLGYLSGGGFYPKGRSQDISNALAELIRNQGGTLLLKTRVDKILLENGAAVGVRTADGISYHARAVVSNASPFETFRRLVADPAILAAEEAKWQKYSVSLSCFQVFLGLKEDLVGKLGITDSEIFVEPSYDPEANYAAMLKGEVDNGGVGITLYDNVFKGYSPAGKNTVNLMVLQGYAPWEKFAEAYRAGDKKAYRKEKLRMADVLIASAEKSLLPGLAKAIQIKEIGTPLTNERYTGHHRGAIYGWDQTVNNSGGTRAGHKTPVRNLYLAGAWSNPGHGYGAVIPSGLQCFAEIMKSW